MNPASKTNVSFFRSLRGKLILLFLAVSLIPLITVGILAYTQAQQALEAEATAKLVAVRDVKSDQIETYFATIDSQVNTLSKDPMIIQAMRDFKQSFHSLEADLALDQAEVQRRETTVRGYYQSEYLARLNPNLAAPASVDTYWPADVKTHLAQYLYLADNPNPTGSKENLDDAGDGSRYSQYHRTYHPIIRDFLREFGYYDIFLVDSETGHIVYTVFKEVDYATSLLTGPYRDTNLARAFRVANAAADPNFVYLADFETYHPSYNAPASFIASPIFDGNEKIGVLLFQMPIDRINAIMQGRAGMGESGETYLVGEDKLWRSDSRFLANLGAETTILNQDFQVDTVAAQKALAGESDVQVIDDYRGVPVLSAYKPLNIGDVKWVILAEIDEAEAFAPAQQMLIAMLIIMGVGAVVVAGVAFLSARTIANPVLAVTEAARKLAIGDVNQTVEVKSRDEIGVMAQSFTQMIAYQQQMAEAANYLAQGNVTVDVTPQSEQDVLGNAFTRMVAYQKQMAETAGRLAQGDVTAEITPQSDKDVLGNAFTRMIAYMQQMAGAAGRLAQGDVTAAVTAQSDKDVLGHAFNQMIAYQQQMAQAATRLAQGDLTTNVTPQSQQDALGNAFSQMIVSLRDLIKQTQESAEQVASASQQLNTAAEQAGQAGQQVATTIQQIAQGTIQQTQGVTEATNNVAQMAHAADGIARGAQEQAHGVQNTSTLINEMAAIVDQVGQVANSVTGANAKVTEAARHGATAVKETSQGMATIRTHTAGAAAKVKEMGARSKEIGRIVDTIDEIADKTDMLALNAAVEAARAGEHGRGFAVVADQVRKLSEDSKVATRDIGDLIDRVQETVNEAIAAMDSTVTEVDNGAQLAGETTQALQEIFHVAEEAADLAGRIGQAVNQLKQKSEGVVAAVEAVSAVVEENTAVAEELAANSQEVTGAMEGVASIAEENSAATEEVSASAEEMSAQVEEVVASAEELSALAEELRLAVAQFQLEERSPIQPERMNQRPTPPAISISSQRPRAAVPVMAHHDDGQK